MTEQPFVRAAIGADVTLRDLAGEPVEVHLVQVASGLDDECWALLRVSAPAWSRLSAAGAFNAMAEVRGAPGAFAEELPIHLTVRLRAELVAPLGADSEAVVEAVARALLTPAEDAASRRVRATEAWLLCEAVQALEVPDDPDARVEIGLRTRWAPDSADAEGPPTLAASVEAYAAAQGWALEAVGAGLYRAGVQLPSGERWVLLWRVDEARGWVGVYSVLPQQVPEALRPALGLFLVSQNYDLPLGAFEMDAEDGEIRYRTSMVTLGEPLTHARLDALVEPHLDVVTVHFDAIAELSQP